jgi:hypothetical protein
MAAPLPARAAASSTTGAPPWLALADMRAELGPYLRTL